MSLTQEQIETLEAYLTPDDDEDVGLLDRGGFYLEYYEMIKDTDPEAAQQVLIQAHISTYSGFFGGAAIIGNAIAKYANPEAYSMTLDRFSYDIAAGLLSGISADFGTPSGGVLTASEIQMLDQGVWDAHQMGDYFPGNIQLVDEQGVDALFSAGTLAAAIAGYQLIFGSRLGFEAADYSGPNYERVETDDYTVIYKLYESGPDAGNREKVVFVEEHLGILDSIIPEEVREEPSSVLVANQIVKQLTGFDLVATLQQGITLLNEAAGNAVGTAVQEAMESVFTDSELDPLLQQKLTSFLGAHGEALDPSASFPLADFAWTDFPLILRNEGVFDDNSEAHILFGYDTAEIYGGFGEDLLIGFANSILRGGGDDDLMVAKANSALFGDAGNDIIIGFEQVVSAGGAGDDWLFAFDTSQADGAAGDDLLVGFGESTLSGGDGADRVAAFDQVVADGGADDDLMFASGSATVDGGLGNDVIFSFLPEYVDENTRLQIDGGGGDDSIFVLGGEGAIVHGGAGDDWIFVWNFAAEVYGDEGADRFFWAPDILIADAEAQDRLSFFGFTLTGGIAYGGEESVWASQSFLPFIRYGLNTEGELVVDAFGHQMFVADYVGGPGAAENTLGIYLARIEFAFYQILDERPALQASPLSAVIGAQLKAAGIIHPDDPLALDLDGDGLEFTGLNTSDTYFDLDGDGFAEHTAWLRSDDGFLAMDRDGDGAIGDISELFGAPGVSGFSELAELDSNADGIIDALDGAFGDLLVWRDLNQDGASGADELFSLADLGITSINLGATIINVETPSQNVLHAQSTFTWSDGSQGNLYDVLLDSSQFDTRYQGDAGAADWAAAVPDIKGYGLLTDLQVAVSNDLPLAETLAQVSANLDVIDLDALAAATEPLLLAWNAANANSQELAPVLVQTDANGAEWLDHGIYQEDAQGGYWTLASGNAVLDGQGDPIARPTLEDLLAQTPGTDQAWRLEQLWSPQRSDALNDRPEAPYKVALDAVGKVAVLDYGIHHEDAQGSYWTLASGTAVLDGLGNAIGRPTLEDVLAQSAGAGEAWRVESFAAPEASAVIDSFAVFSFNGQAVDYSVYVDDPEGGYWASAQAVAEAISLGQATPAGATHADLQSFVDLYLAENAGSITGSEVVDAQKAGYAIKTGGAELSDLNNLVAGVDAQGQLVYVQNVEQQAEFLQEVLERYEFWGEAVAVRLASQTGLSSFFQGVVYNPETDVFEAATSRELIPLYEQIFAAAPGDAQGALDYLQDWRDILNVVYADFGQHGNGAMSASFVFANVVAAYESQGLAVGILEAAAILGVPTGSIIHDTTDNAVVDGTNGRDIFYLSEGDQTLRGGQDSDAYVVGKNFGHDVIDDSEAPLSNRGPDLIRFADTASTEVSAHREGID